MNAEKQRQEYSNTSNSYKMACSHHFIPFSVFGVSISINCLFVRAQTQFILLTLTSYNRKKVKKQFLKNIGKKSDKKSRRPEKSDERLIKAHINVII